MTFSPIVPQNVDLSISPRDYKDLPANHLWVHGEFYTIQGEGPFAGKTAYFVRLAGCNYGDKDLHCKFCDTSFHFQNGKSINVSDIYDRFEASKAKVLVVTGGEPLLQIEGLIDLANLCFDKGRTIQIETNGVYFTHIPRLFEAYPGIEIVISPKAHEVKGYSESLMRGISRAIDRGAGTCHLKILVGSQHPYDVLPPLDEFSDWFRHNNIYLSPITVYKKPTNGEVASAWDPDLVDHYQTAANHAKVAQLCMDHNFNMSMQMHNFALIP